MRTTYFALIASWRSAVLHVLFSLSSLLSRGRSIIRLQLARSSVHLRALVVSLLLAATLLAGFNTPFAYGMGASHVTVQTPSPQGKPHKVDPKSGAKSVLHLPPASNLPPASPPLADRPAMSHGFVPTMKPGLLKLDPNNPTQFVGSDGRLEIDVPAGAITAADVAPVAGHTLGLRITEIAPPSGSNAGSAAISLGSYTVQVVDGQGNASDLFTHGLRKNVTLKLHYNAKERALGLDRAFVVFNGAHPQNITVTGSYSTQPVTDDSTNNVLQSQLPADAALVAPAAPAAPTPTATPTTTPTESPTATVTPEATLEATPTTTSTSTTKTIGASPRTVTTATYTQQTPPTTFTFNTYPPIAKFGNPDPLNVDLNSGSLTEGIQLDVPPGPAGAMPNLTLAYNSAAVSEQHSPQGAAGWVGEGWSLSLGSISWAEHNVVPTCTTSCTNSWQSQWMLNDPFGTSTELIPPNLATATYYDDSTNYWCTTGVASATACPIQFQTARESYAKVYAYVGPTFLGGQPDPFACFRVYLTNGVMEEFGCTADSLQYYPIQPGSIPHQGNANLYYPVAWLLDLITNPQGDQVHITYQKDTTTAPDGISYTRDVVPATIEWDSPGAPGTAACVNAKQMCTGTGGTAPWQPHYRVQFVASHHSVTHLTNSPSGCNPDATVRCDDPATITGTNGSNAPLVNGTFVLNDANVQTNNTSGGGYNGSSWNTVRDYQFSYEQSGPTQITDPVTGKNLSSAGYLDLTKFQQVGDDSATAYPPMNFGYSGQTEYYEDGSYTPYSTTFCGPTWNTGGNGGACDLWSQSYDGNSRYLATIDNGQGLEQTVAWNLARNNTHGVNSGVPADIVNPLYCNGLSGAQKATYPCNSADDQAWSRIVATGRTDTVNQLTQAGQGGTQTTLPVASDWAYTYQLSSLIAKECTDCVAGMYWGNQNDGDYMDYYNGKFMGFAQASISNPDGSVVTHKYEATEGWGVYTLNTTLVPSCPSTLPPISGTCQLSPWWDVANAGHGLETETDYLDTDGTTLLKKTTATYNAVCPPSGVSATPQYTGSGSSFGPWGSNQVSELDHNNPVAVCDVQQTQQVTTTYDGTANSITATDNSTYDTYGQVTQTQRISSSGGGSPTTIYDKTAYIRNDGLTLPPAQRSTTNQSPSSSTSWWNGAYLIDLPALQTVEDSASGGGRYSCNYTLYDGAAYTTGQASGLTKGNVSEQDTYTGCGTTPSYTPSGKVGATTSYDPYGNATASQDPDAYSGDAAHKGAPGTSCAGNTTCAQYDGTTQAKTTGSSNAGNLTSASGYDTTPAYGFGLWPKTTTDANGQTTTYTYDALGRMLTMVAPGQTSGPATQTTAYYNVCGTTSPSSPCVEVDTTTRTSGSSSVLSRQFYDGENRLVETRTAAPGGQDVVQYTLYNAAGQAAQSSVKYFVTAYTGPGGVAAAYSTPDSTQDGTLTAYDGLGRMTQATDALSNVGKISYSIVCNAPGTSDAACYEQTLAVDPNSHQQGSLSDAFGRAIYAQRYSGASAGTYAVSSTAKTSYDSMGRVTQTQQPDGHTATASYDAAGHLTSATDPDRGLTSFAYDSNGNLTQQTDARCGTSLPQTACSAGTAYTGYDGLNRPIWRNTSNMPSGAYVTYSYDGSPTSNGLGHLTAEVFRGSAGTGANPFSGAYTYAYDAHGRTIRTDQTMGGAGQCPSAAAGWTCQDVGSPGQAGSQSDAGDGIWTVSGGGTDIVGTSDQFHFVAQGHSGDATLSAHVASQTNTDPWAKAGVMVRASTAANAPFYAVLVTPGNGIVVQYRDTAGTAAVHPSTVNGAAPAYVAVARQNGSTYSGYTSADGVTWTYIPGSSHGMGNLTGTVQMGLAATAHNNATVSTATFDTVNVTTGGANVCPTGTPGWTCQDVGSPALAGSQTYLTGGVWSVAGAGADIAGTSDQFHFVSASQAGDGSLSAHVDTQTNTDPWAKAGLMARAGSGTAANAPFYAVVVSPGNGIAVQYRDSAGATAVKLATASGVVPAYLKVGRVGTTYTAYTSSDGVTWTAITGSARSMSALSGTVQLGLAVTAHNVGALSQATFDQISAPSGVLTPPGAVTVTPIAAASGTTSYPMQTAYNDASQPTSLTYSDNEVASYGYDASSGWLSSLSTTPAGGSATSLLDTIGYSGAGGAAGHATSANVAGGTYSYSASYDVDTRLSSLSLTNVSTSSMLFRSQRGYDAASNVTAVNTTLSAGTDNQVFCYDEQNRLTWAGASGTPSCGSSLTAGSLSVANYTQTFAYDTLDRLTSGPLGGYTYGDAAHLHGVTAIGSGPTYTASYDAVGDMTCRAPDTTTTCAGTQTGAQLGYDNEGRLTAWQNAPSSPTATDGFLYDGAGNRVEQLVTVNGSITTTTTYVAGGLEEINSNAVGTTLTKYFAASGLPTAERVGTGGPLSYLATDGQGTVSTSLDGAGNVTSAQLYLPYGNVRYSSGSSPTSLGYTGQQADGSTGLDYYRARYYDPVAEQFVSADTVNDGINHYSYVHGNPETYTDSTGHRVDQNQDGVGGTLPQLKLMQLYFLLAITNRYSALAMYLWSYDAWKMAEAYAEEYAHTSIMYITGQEAYAYRQSKPRDFWEQSGDTMHEYLVVEGATAWYIQGATGTARDDHLDIRNSSNLGSQTTESGDGFRSGSTETSTDSLSSGCSFANTTLVATPTGARAIRLMRVGDIVEAYNSSTRKVEARRVEHIWVHMDHDLVDVRLRVWDDKTHRSHDETIHTTLNHPWLSAKGWTAAGDLKTGEMLLTLRGSYGQILWVHRIHGSDEMYNLTVSTDHTFAVGAGLWIVHNTCNVSGGELTEDQALHAAQEWLGSGYREIAPGVYRSADGTRQFRMTASDLTDPRQGPHVHFEVIGPDGREIIENDHVLLIGGSP